MRVEHVSTAGVKDHISTATPYVSNAGGVSTESTTATATSYVPLFPEY